MQNATAYSKPVTLKNILKFAVPTIAMSVFMSFYTMVDGLFVSNLIGTNALSAINLVYPVIALVTAISTMLATGGSAVIMKKMGEGKPDEAKQDFTFLILVNVLAGLVMCGIGYLFTGKMFNAMSLTAEVSGYCKEYLNRYLLFTIPILLMNNFTLGLALERSLLVLHTDTHMLRTSSLSAWANSRWKQILRWTICLSPSFIGGSAARRLQPD